MKFDFTKRSAHIGKISLREEHHGEDKKLAVDVPLRFEISMQEFDMVAPCRGVKLSKILFDDGGRPVTHLLFPLSVNRKPDRITLTIYTHQIEEEKSKLVFNDVTIKGILIDIKERGAMMLECKAQFRPTAKDRERLIDCMGEARHFECFASQSDLFQKEEDEEVQELGVH
jgi:hypothetical protein